LREADIVCAATTSPQPVFNDHDLREGAHINGVGSYTPEMQEISSLTVARSKVVVDSRSACLAEAGDIIIPLNESLIDESHIHGEIGEIAAGTISGRETDQEITFFKSVGLAVQDVAVASVVMRRAKELGLGRDIEI
jgi:ornithine cyclodeaminase